MKKLTPKRSRPVFISRLNHGPRAAFTLVEVMVSMVVLAIMLMLIAQIIGVTQRSWRSASSRLAQFREARIAFDTITRNLRQATLNAYRDYHYAATNSNVPSTNSPSEAPDGTRRISELAFVSGQAKDLVKKATGSTDDLDTSSLSGHAVFFQAPLGVTDPATSPTLGGRPKYENLKHLLCGRGYFVRFGTDKSYLPKGLFNAGRLKESQKFHLMEYQPPAEKNTIYDSVSQDDWFKIDTAYLRPVSDKIVGLILSPRLSAGEESIMSGGASVQPTSIAPKYEYDSRKTSLQTSTGNTQGSQHLLPPVVKVAMIALDDRSIETLLSQSRSANLDVLSAAGASFTDANRYEEDMAAVKSYLTGLQLNYRIFESAIVIPASRWTL